MVRTDLFQGSNRGSIPRSATMHPKYQEVIKLRKEGKTYREIAKSAGVSKNSVSRWCKNLKLPLIAQRILKKKNKQNKEIFIKYNRLKAERVRIENLKIEKRTAKEIQAFSKYELKLMGAVLYWAEGYKNKATTQSNKRIDFVNSDPYVIALFLRFLREIIQIPEEKLKASIRVHPNINV